MGIFQKEMKKSWLETKKNPILFAPKIFSITLSIIILTVLLSSIGVFGEFAKSGFSVERLGLILKSLVFTLPFWIYLIIEIIISVFFSGMSLGMYKDITLKKKTSLKKGFNYGIKYFWNIIKISILYYILIGVALFALVYAVKIFALFNIFLSLAIFSFYLILILYWLFLVILRLFFVYAAMVFGKGGALQSVRIGAQFGKIHFKHTLITWLIVVGIYLLVNLTKQPVVSNNHILITLIAILFFTILEIVVSVWEHVFVFNMYLDDE